VQSAAAAFLENSNSLRSGGLRRGRFSEQQRGRRRNQTNRKSSGAEHHRGNARRAALEEMPGGARVPGPQKLSSSRGRSLSGKLCSDPTVQTRAPWDLEN
jgi:hypothetical protein